MDPSLGFSPMWRILYPMFYLSVLGYQVQMSTMEQKKNRLIQTVSSDWCFSWALVPLLRMRRACLAVTFWLEHAFWIFHAKNPMWNFLCTSTMARPHDAKTYHFNCNCFHADTMTLNKTHGLYHIIPHKPVTTVTATQLNSLIDSYINYSITKF